MPDDDPLGTLVSDLGSSLESSVLSAITDPVVGWISALFGPGGDDDGVQTELAELQGDVASIIGDIGALGSSLEKYISAELAATSIQNALTVVQTFQNSGRAPAKAMTVPGDMIEDKEGYLQAIHDTLVGPAPGGDPGGTAFLTTYLDTYLPQYYADASPMQVGLSQCFLYHQKLQAVLMQMTVEAAHEGQVRNPVTPPSLNYETFGSLPPNYVTAQQAFTQYVRQIAEQSTFLPFPTTGVGLNLGWQYPTGAEQIVFDRKTPLAWAWRSWGCVGNIVEGLTSVSGVQNMLNIAGAWMLRVPTYAEISAFHDSLLDAQGKPVTSSTIGASLGQLGFNLAQLQPITATNGVPFFTNEALQPANWQLLNPVWFKHRPPAGTKLADGYKCSNFYDLLNGVWAEVQITCPVTQNDQSQFNVFADIQNASSVVWMSPLGSTSTSLIPPSPGAYADVLFIYQLANADAATNVNTDPPVEEPSSIQVNTPVQNGDGTWQFTAGANFKRFDHTQMNDVNVYLNINEVYWTLENPENANATITPGGLLTWTGQGTVNVVAVRGPLSASQSATAPSSFTPATVVPMKVNIYPRNALVTTANLSQGIGVTFYAQILYSDGSTNPPDPIDLFTFADASGNLKPDSDGASTFTIPVGTSNPIQINLTLKSNPQLTDKATITFQ